MTPSNSQETMSGILEGPSRGTSRFVLDKLRQGLCVFDGSQRLVLFNRRYAEMYDLSPSDLRVGMTLREVVDLRFAAGTGPRMTHEEFMAWRDKVVAERRIAETVVKLRDGRIHEIHHEPTSEGGWVATFDDVTARVQAEGALRDKTALLQLAQEAAGAGLFDWDLLGGGARLSPESLRLFGQPEERATEVASGEWAGIVHPEDLPSVFAESRRAAEAGDTYRAEFRVPQPDGTARWVVSIGRVVVDAAARPVRIVGLNFDVTERKRTEETLRRSEERLALALDSGSDGLWDWDVATGAAWFSDRWHEMLGHAPGELRPSMSAWEDLLHPDDRAKTKRLLSDHLERRAGAFECEHRLRGGDGDWRWVLARGKVVNRDLDGAPLRAVGTMIDIGARKAAEGRIEHMARHDGLTDLPARVLFRERLEQRLAEVVRYGGSCAVLCLDLDRFKAVNDTLGHLAGDILLREIARRLREAVATGDVVARLGGDEFAVLVDRCGGRGELSRLSQRLVDVVGEPVAIGGQLVEVGLSVGIALAPEHGSDCESVFRRADLALYRAKAEGKGTARVFEAAIENEVAERRTLEAELRHAAAKGELLLHYQPQVRAGEGEIVGFEALLRWHHPVHGAVMPSRFIPIAEDGGLMPAIGEWVLRTACTEAASWARQLKVAVNLSPRQFQADLPDRVLAILTETGLAPNRLELEITETALFSDMVRALSVLRRLKAMGITIAMDDFGTGYSSLATLEAFPFDTLKIDRGFVGRIEDSSQAKVIVRAMIGLGRSLGMQVIAEGIESESQAKFLSDEGCNLLQGYLYGRPERINQFADILFAGSDTPGQHRDALRPAAQVQQRSDIAVARSGFR